MDINSFVTGFSMGKKKGGDNTVIDVESLPTENVDDSKIYRIEKPANPTLYIAKDTLSDVPLHIDDFISKTGSPTNLLIVGVFEVLPDKMKPINLETFTVPVYILESSGVGYASKDGTNTTAMSISVLLRCKDGGWVDSVEDIVVSDSLTLYTLRGNGSVITYGVPNIQNNKVIHEYDGGWVNLTEIKGEVEELRTENTTLQEQLDTERAEFNAEIETLNQTIEDNEPYANFSKYATLKMENTWVGTSGATGGYATCIGLYNDSSNKDIKSVIIPNGVSAISNEAFSQCRQLKSVVLPESLRAIGDNVFAGCAELEEINIPSNVTHIGAYGFSACGLLTKVTVPVGVNKLNKGIFSSCYGLTEIILNGVITNISADAFYRCTRLEKINYAGTKEQWKAITFGTGWNDSTGNYTIYCTDGTIAKDGTEA